VSALRTFLSRLRGLIGGSRADRELQTEIESHLAEAVEDNVRQGMAPIEARRVALARFGGMTQTIEAHRDRRSLVWLEHAVQDVRYAVRLVRKHPGFSALVVLILGLGIGANTVVFSALEVLVLRSLPVGDPEQLVLLRTTRTAGNAVPLSNHWISYATYEHVRDHGDSLSGVAVVNGSRNLRTLIPSGLGRVEPLGVMTSDVSGNYFALLQIAPTLGRLLTPEDDRREAPRAVAVLSHAFWRRAFGGDPGVVGKTVRIEAVTFDIVGVAPRGFAGVKIGEPIDVWTPLEMMPAVNPRTGSSLHRPDWFGLVAIARLRPGIARDTAAAQVNALYQQQGAALRPQDSPVERARVWGTMDLEQGTSGFASEMRNRGRPILGILLVVVTLVLLITCANVASLSLAHLASRQRELAARTALGAGRGRLLAQLVTESLLLVGGGALLGLLMMRWGFSIARAYGVDAQPSGEILLFVLLVSSVTGLIVAVIPALKSSRIDLSSVLKSEAGSATGSRQMLQKLLVVVQIAVSGCLLVGTGQFVRTVQNLQKVDVGFPTAGLLLVEIEAPRDYTAEGQTALRREVLQSIQAVPGVQHVTFSEHALLNDTITQVRITVPGYVDVPGEDMTVQFVSVGPDFFETLGIPVLRGHGRLADRSLGSRQAAATAVISEAVARRFFGATDPIGRVIQRGGSQYEVVGVAKNTKYRSLRDDAELVCYIPLGGTPARRIGFQIRTIDDPRGLARAIPGIVQRIDPRTRMRRLETIEAALARATQEDRLIAASVGGFSLLAMLLTSLGLYGMLAYDVGQRTKEIGVRIALGGRSGAIVALILKQSLRLTAVGAVVGIVAAVLLVRLIEHRLYGISPVDPMMFAVTIAVLVVVACVACWVPARRAATLDPMTALRAE
jgi:putative ABC transport system permease protein